MKRYVVLLVVALAAVQVNAQRENPNSAVSRNLETFNDVYKQLDLFYVDSLNADTVMEWAIRAMLNRVDPFTDYFPENDEDLRQMATGKYAGIGSLIRFHRKLNRVAISEPYEGTPSQLAGVKAGDIILRIDGKDVLGKGTSEVSNMLRGEAGTTFELVVSRDGQEVTFPITRQVIQMPQVPYYGMVNETVGYIFLTGFTEGACREVRQALTELRSQGAKQLVLDLRGNPGGAINEAVDIVNLFVPKGKKVVYTKGKMTHTNREYLTASEPVDTQMPLVVLVDGGSASSSEIVSGSLQDLDRAVILGARTYGKGMAQMVRELPHHGSLKLTTSRYYIPSGRCIQAYDYRHLNADGSVGVVPDSLTKVFHTANGREVRDGGGIKPDVVVRPDSLPTLISDLVASDEFFDWGTRYAAAHPTIASAGEFQVSDEDYAQFVEEIASSGFTYNRRSEDVLKLLRDVAKREGYLEQAEAEFEALRNKLQGDIRTDLMRFRKQIEPYMADELMPRYFYQRGLAKQALVGDPCMERALKLLASPEEYKQILSGK